MPLLQIIAAYCSDVNVLHFHKGGDDRGFLAALETIQERMPEWEQISLDELIESILSLSFDWGVSGGN